MHFLERWSFSSAPKDSLHLSQPIFLFFYFSIFLFLSFYLFIFLSVRLIYVFVSFLPSFRPCLIPFFSPSFFLPCFFHSLYSSFTLISFPLFFTFHTSSLIFIFHIFSLLSSSSFAFCFPFLYFFPYSITFLLSLHTLTYREILCDNGWSASIFLESFRSGCHCDGIHFTLL